MAQEERVEEIPFGNMDQWIDRQIKESGIIGGDMKHVYAIGPAQTITNNEAYKNLKSAATVIVPVWIPAWRA